MIQKIESIKNIGNFEDYIARGDVSLKKMNFIYAENGSGKTTLARIMQSLSSGDADIIHQHQRIGTEAPSTIAIKDEHGTSFNFNGTTWNRRKNNIEVFDAHFVTDNIYSGFQINSEHRKHLYKFVLGSTGVDIAKKIDRVKQLIEQNNTELSRLAEQIKLLSKHTDVHEVCNIQPIENIDELIELKKKELSIAQNNNTILQQSVLPLLPTPSFSFDVEKLKRILSTSIEGIGQEYLETVTTHLHKLQSHGLSDSEQWVYTGFKLINGKDNELCPFCGNSIDNLALIKGYNQYFSDTYIKVVQSAKECKDNIISINTDAFATRILTTNDRVIELYKFWANYITTEVELPIFDYDLSKLHSCIQSIKEIITKKQANPLERLPIDMVNEYVSELHTLSEKIRIINEYVSMYNNKISNLKNQIRKKEDVENELHVLTLNKARYEEPLGKYCSLYKQIENHIKKWQKINKDLQHLQKAESNRVFELYGQKINHYLHTVFNTNFQIANIRDGGFKGRAKEANLEYILTFNGTIIEQDGNSNTSFKNILSEGDKNTIAFSFFLAKVTTDTDFSNKIILFDDPLTSLDLNRRNTTIHQLVVLQQQCKQVIILSHNLHFLVELYSRKQIKTCDKKVLQIINSSGKSSIREYAIKKDWIDNYQKSLDLMEIFLSDPSSDEKKEDAINAIRIAIETFLKLKYCKHITNSEQTFGQIIHELESSTCDFVNPDKACVIDKLNQLLQISWRSHHGSIEEREIYSEITISMVEAQQYVNMALHLLYKEL